ncbi:MAG: transposase [Planctomycetes bacterium]|nr:transposase [Planctomycetota bacterium]
MRGSDASQTLLFNFVTIEERVPAKHPIRTLRSAAAAVLAELRPRIDQAYDRKGRMAIPAEQVLRALVVWAFYAVPSERQLLESLEYNLLFRWFVGLELGDHVWSREAFRRNRRRLHDCGAVAEFLARLCARSRGRLLANPHFSVNRSLLEEWGGQTSLTM